MKRSSAPQVAKLTERLSMPKDYSKIAIADRKARLQSTDSSPNQGLRKPSQPRNVGLNFGQQLPALQSALSAHRHERKADNKLMSVDFSSRQGDRQFMNRTVMDSFSQSHNKRNQTASM